MIQTPELTGGEDEQQFLADRREDGLAPAVFPKSHGKLNVDDRRVLSSIVFINRNGLRWCDAPREYGPPKTLYNGWKRWGNMGVFARVRLGEGDRPLWAVTSCCACFHCIPRELRFAVHQNAEVRAT